MPRLKSRDDRQRPDFFYPGLPSQHFYDRSTLSWTNVLLSQFAVLRAELDAGLRRRSGFHAIFPGYEDAGCWAGLWFHLYGHVFDENCAQFPQTANILGAIPRLAGWAAYSALAAGAHVRPHCGITNAKLRVHLALRADSGSRMRVGDDVYEWSEGELVVFDDSFEHEVWVAGTRPRVVLIIDVWHPALTDDEVAFLERLEREPSAFWGGSCLRDDFRRAREAEQAAARPGDMDWLYDSLL